MTTKPKKRDDLDLLPKAEAMKRTDALLRAMLSSPPEPFTPKKQRKK